jgi:hypothetical protein
MTKANTEWMEKTICSHCEYIQQEPLLTCCQVCSAYEDNFVLIKNFIRGA